MLLSKKDIGDLKESKFESGSDQPQLKSRRLNAAFQVFRQTGSLTPAIEGLSFRTRAQTRLRQLTRRTNLYLILIVVTALAGLSFFWFELRPELEMIRADITTTSNVELSEPYYGLMTLVCVVILLLVLLALVKQLFGKTNWFTRFSGAEAYLELGQQASESTKMAGELLGVDSQQQTLPGGSACQSIEQISSARALMETLADQKMESVSNAFPTTALVVVGGGCAMICILTTFYPVVRLLGDLSSVGI